MSLEDSKLHIPVGTYLCKRYLSPKFERYLFEITNVPGKEGVAIHAGNIVADTEGCVLLAEKLGKLYGDPAILNSGNTFNKFMSRMGEANFSLTIVEVLA